jgi:hypothetical protein
MPMAGLLGDTPLITIASVAIGAIAYWYIDEEYDATDRLISYFGG